MIAFSWVSDELVNDMPVRVLSVAKDVVLGDRLLGVSWACILYVTGHKVAFRLLADEEMVSWQARLVLARELFSRIERVSVARGHWSDGGHSWQPIVEYPS